MKGSQPMANDNDPAQTFLRRNRAWFDGQNAFSQEAIAIDARNTQVYGMPTADSLRVTEHEMRYRHDPTYREAANQFERLRKFDPKTFGDIDIDQYAEAAVAAAVAKSNR